MPSWPASLPQTQFLNMTEQRQDARVRTTMDAGPAKMRRRFTTAVRAVVTPIVLDGTQRQAFDSFWINDTQEGSLKFSWSDPATDSTVNFRFVSPPMWTLDSGGAAGIPATSGATGTRLWRAQLHLEIVP
jgi:hypothetical protein